MRQKLQGQVVIHLVISTNGDVLSAEPVTGNPIFTQAAVTAMRQWKFQPYIRNGQPVQIGYKMPYDFAMADRVVDNPKTIVNPSLKNETPPSSATNQPSASMSAQITSGQAQGLLV
jgi:TonB family protein